MNLDAAFPLSKLRPPEDREAQIDGGGIECVDIPFQIKDIDFSAYRSKWVFFGDEN